jgi:hypothetical protein
LVSVDAAVNGDWRSKRVSSNDNYFNPRPRMIPSEHLSRQRAGMNGIFDHYRAVDQNGGAAPARILMRIGIRFSALLGSNSPAL